MKRSNTVSGSKRRLWKPAMITAASLAALAAGAYVWYGKGGASRRRKLQGWAKRMAREVRARAARVDRLNRQAFHRVVDRVADRYGKLKQVNAEELRGASKDLKGVWNREVKKPVKG